MFFVGLLVLRALLMSQDLLVEATEILAVKDRVQLPCRLAAGQQITTTWRVHTDKPQLSLVNELGGYVFHYSTRYTENAVVRNKMKADGDWGTEERSGGWPFPGGLGDLATVRLELARQEVDMYIDGQFFVKYVFKDNDTLADVAAVEHSAYGISSELIEVKFKPGLTSFTKAADTSLSQQPLVTSLQRSWTHCLLDCCNSAVLGCSAVTYNNLTHQCHLYNLDDNPATSTAPGWTSYSRGGTREEKVYPPS